EIPFEDGEEVFEEGVDVDDELQEIGDTEDEPQEELDAEDGDTETEDEKSLSRVDPPEDVPVPVKKRRKKQQQSDDREVVISELNKAADGNENPKNYELPPIELLIESDDFSFDEQEREVRKKAKVLEKTFLSFGFNVKVVEIETGPVIAQYEVELEAGLRLS